MEVRTPFTVGGSKWSLVRCHSSHQFQGRTFISIERPSFSNEESSFSNEKSSFSIEKSSFSIEQSSIIDKTDRARAEESPRLPNSTDNERK